MWETLRNPDRDELVAGFNEAERVHAPHHLWHYSNLVFSMLGELVAARRLDERELLDLFGVVMKVMLISGIIVLIFSKPIRKLMGNIR